MSGTCPIELPGIEPIRQIGVGGFGEVWLANQVGFDRHVAMKIARRPFIDDDDARRFERECKALGRLTGHPNIVDVHLSGFQDNLPYLVMEYIDGGTLAQHGRSLSEADLRIVAVQLCGAVEAAHGLGVLHRDLKPENVFLRQDRSAVLGDFGIARLSDGTNTVAGRVTATVAFAAPEILNGQPATELVDVYGIGVTLASAIIGRSPYCPSDEMTIEAIMARVFDGVPPDLTAFGMSHQFSELIRWAMAPDPQQRPQSAAELLSHFQALAETNVGPAAGSSANATDAHLGPATNQVPPWSPGQHVAVTAEDQARSLPEWLLPASLAGVGALIVAALAVWAFAGNDDEPEVANGPSDQLTEPVGNDSTNSATSTPNSPSTSTPSSTPTPSATSTSTGEAPEDPEVTVEASVPKPPLVIPISSTEVSDIADIPIDQAGWDELSGPANSQQFCEVRPDITGLVDTTAALYPTDPTAGATLRQVTIRMHRFSTSEQAADFMRSYTTITCDGWDSTEFSNDGLTSLRATATQPVTDYGDDTRQVDQQATLPSGFIIWSRSLLVRSDTDVMKLVYLTLDEGELDEITDRLAERSIGALGY